jgi:hypothetical protein
LGRRQKHFNVHLKTRRDDLGRKCPKIARTKTGPSRTQTGPSRTQNGSIENSNWSIQNSNGSIENSNWSIKNSNWSILKLVHPELNGSIEFVFGCVIASLSAIGGSGNTNLNESRECDEMAIWLIGLFFSFLFSLRSFLPQPQPQQRESASAESFGLSRELWPQQRTNKDGILLLLHEDEDEQYGGCEDEDEQDGGGGGGGRRSRGNQLLRMLLTIHSRPW